VELTDRNQSLKIALFKPENEEKYVCVVKNRLHKDLVDGYVTIAGERERDVFPIEGSGHTEYSLFIMYILQTENGATL
jgi:hypothetical protein